MSERVVSGKQLWLLVGGNGAGKSTFHRLFLEPLGLPFVNADNLAKLIEPDAPQAHGLEAALLAEQQRELLLLRGFSFCFETVYSRPSKVDFVARAKALGYEVILVLIHLNNASLNQARIAQRISEGGHHVPAEKVIGHLLNNVQASLALCDQVRLVDNSSADHPFLPVATIIAGVEQRHQDPLPAWAHDLIG